MNTLEFSRISYKNVFSNLSFKIKKGDNLAILASSGSGKSTVLNIINNSISYNGCILINGVEIVETNYYLIDKFIEIANDSNYPKSKVVDILFDLYEDLGNDSQERKVKRIVKQYDLNQYLDYYLDELPNDIKYYLIILLKILKNKDYLIVDNLFSYLRREHIDLIYVYAKKNKISIINLTSDIRNVINSNYMLVIYNGKIVMEGPTLSCLLEEKLLKRLGYYLPFYVDLSLQLNYYEILNNIYLDKESMVDAIWK